MFFLPLSQSRLLLITAALLAASFPTTPSPPCSPPTPLLPPPSCWGLKVSWALSLWLMPHPDLNLYAIMGRLRWVIWAVGWGRVTQSERGGGGYRITKHSVVLHLPPHTHTQANHQPVSQPLWRCEECPPCQQRPPLTPACAALSSVAFCANKGGSSSASQYTKCKDMKEWSGWCTASASLHEQLQQRFRGRLQEGQLTGRGVPLRSTVQCFSFCLFKLHWWCVIDAYYESFCQI